MVKLIIRFLVYFLIFVALSTFVHGVAGDVPGFALVALLLAVANLLIRPLLTVAALPFNLLTFGLASVFVNMLTLIIADAIVLSAGFAGFWTLALAAVLVMAADGCIRAARHTRMFRG